MNTIQLLIYGKRSLTVTFAGRQIIGQGNSHILGITPVYGCILLFVLHKRTMLTVGYSGIVTHTYFIILTVNSYNWCYDKTQLIID